MVAYLRYLNIRIAWTVLGALKRSAVTRDLTQSVQLKNEQGQGRTVVMGKRGNLLFRIRKVTWGIGL